MRTNTIILLSAISLSINMDPVAAEFTDCLDIYINIERLDCYDHLAREERQKRSEETKQKAIEFMEPQAVKQKSMDSITQPPIDKVVVDTRIPSNDDSIDLINSIPPKEKKKHWINLFGKREKPKKIEEQIKTSIKSIKKTPLGKHIMTLSNGQVWIENEPGRRVIKAGQVVTIKKKRFHFEMKLTSGGKIAVNRID